MAQYYVNMNNYPTGALSSSDWSFRQNNGGASATVLSSTDGNLIRTDATAIGTKVMAYTPLNGANDVEALIKFRLASDFGKQGIVSLRYGGNTEANTKGYTLSGSVIGSVGTLAIDEGSTGYAAWTPWNYLANTTYWVRFRVIGNSLRAKVWTDGTAEPSTWALDVTNSIATTGSFSGFHQYRNESIFYLYASFATDGDTAPASPEEYQQYLNSLVPQSTPLGVIGGGYGGVGGYGIGYGEAIRPGVTTVDANQSGSAMIQRISLVGQSATARIQKSITRIQQANARLQRSELKTQAGNARIARQEMKNQYAVARIQASAPRTQPARAMISIVTTKTQPASATIAELGTVALQSGVARITAMPLRTQSGNARIRKSVTRTTTGRSRIQKSVLKTQPALASIRKDTPKTQVGNAAILQGILRDQNAIARIQRIISADQSGVSRIQKSITRTVIGNARIRIFVIRNQLANSAILRIPQQHQPAHGLIAKEMITTQPGGAFIIRVNEYQNPPRIGIRPQIGGQPSMVDGRGVTDIDVAKSRVGMVAERPRVNVVNTRPRARQ